jgi:hypothetical protein
MSKSRKNTKKYKKTIKHHKSKKHNKCKKHNKSKKYLTRKNKKGGVRTFTSLQDLASNTIARNHVQPQELIDANYPEQTVNLVRRAVERRRNAARTIRRNCRQRMTNRQYLDLLYRNRNNYNAEELELLDRYAPDIINRRINYDMQPFHDEFNYIPVVWDNIVNEESQQQLNSRLPKRLVPHHLRTPPHTQDSDEDEDIDIDALVENIYERRAL